MLALSADPITYTLTYTADDGGSISGSSPQTVAAGESGTAVEAVPENGYSFCQWSDGSTANPRMDVSVTADVSVIAQFKPDTITQYAEWLIGLGLAEGEDDPDSEPLGDGLSNLLKYAFNLDPTAYGAVQLTPGVSDSGLPYVSLSEGNELQVEYVRRKNAVDLIYYVEFADGLAAGVSWSADGIEVSATDIDDDWERVIVEDGTELPADGARFVRMTVGLVEN